MQPPGHRLLGNRRGSRSVQRCTGDDGHVLACNTGRRSEADTIRHSLASGHHRGQIEAPVELLMQRNSSLLTFPCSSGLRWKAKRVQYPAVATYPAACFAAAITPPCLRSPRRPCSSCGCCQPPTGVDVVFARAVARWAATARRRWCCASFLTAPGRPGWPPTTGSAPRRPTVSCTRASTLWPLKRQGCAGCCWPPGMPLLLGGLVLRARGPSGGAAPQLSRHGCVRCIREDPGKRAADLAAGRQELVGRPLIDLAGRDEHGGVVPLVTILTEYNTVRPHEALA